MKYTKIIGLLLVSSLVIFGCKKVEEELEQLQNIDTDRGANDHTASDELEEVWDNVFTALEDDSTEVQTGRSSAISGIVLPCGAVSVQRNSNGNGYTFTYGTNCGSRALSGKVSASLLSGSKWEDKGATLEIKFDNYEVLFNSNGEVLTFNGNITVTNVDGGLLWQTTNFFGNTPKVIKHDVGGVVDITFDKGDTRKWTITKRRTYQSTSGNLEDITATLSANGPVAETGTAKDGSPYTMTIPTPVVWEVCNSPQTLDDPFDLVITRGKIKKTVGSYSVEGEFGYKYDDATEEGTLVNDCSSDAAKLTFTIGSRSIVNYQKY